MKFHEIETRKDADKWIASETIKLTLKSVVSKFKKLTDTVKRTTKSICEFSKLVETKPEEK